MPTLACWYYGYRAGALAALHPERRSDRGHAQRLTEGQRELLLGIRKERPRVSAALILRTREADGRIDRGVVRSRRCADSSPEARPRPCEQGAARLTLSVAGTDFEFDASYLCGRLVVVGRCLLDPNEPPWVEHEEQRLSLRAVDARSNARRGPAQRAKAA